MFPTGGDQWLVREANFWSSIMVTNGGKHVFNCNILNEEVFVGLLHCERNFRFFFIKVLRLKHQYEW